MKKLILLFTALCFGLSLTACGVKRELKLPSEIQKKEQKKQHKDGVI